MDYLINEESPNEIRTTCDDWWEITKESDVVFEIFKIFKDTNIRKVIRESLILEAITIAFLKHFNTQMLKPCTETLDCLKNMLYYNHQNFLNLICFIIGRMGLESVDKNVWANALKDLV